MVLNIPMVYYRILLDILSDWCIPGIYQFSVCLCNYIATIDETTATTQIQQVLIAATMEDIARTHEKSFFTQKVYTTGLCPVYTCQISSAARFLALRVLAVRWDESDLDWMWILSVLVTGTYQKALQFEDGACKSTTARCCSCKIWLPLRDPARQHTQTRGLF